MKLPVYIKFCALNCHLLKDKENLLYIFYVPRTQNEAMV